MPAADYPLPLGKAMNNLPLQKNEVEESQDEVLTLASFFDLLAKFDFEDKQKEKLTEQINQTQKCYNDNQHED